MTLKINRWPSAPKLWTAAMLWMLSVLLLTACAGSPPTPDDTVNSRTGPTSLPPAWVQSADVITLENVPELRYLGRLDSTSEPTTIFAHSLSPDGTRLAGLDNEQLMVWDLISGETIFGTARSSATHVFFSPDKTEVYSLTPQGVVTIYNANDGTTQNTFDAIDNFDDVSAFYAEDGWMAFGNLRGQVKIWDPLERTALATIDAHSLRVTALAFSDDGRLLATAGEDGQVKVWNWQEREVLNTLPDNQSVSILSFAPDNSQLAVGTRQNTRLWSLADSALERVIDTGPGGVELLAYSPDGRFLVSGGTPKDMSVWDPTSGGIVARLPDIGRDRVSMAFSPDGNLLLTAVLGGRATLWNMTTITSSTVNRADLSTEGLVYDVDWSSDNRLLTIFGTTGGVYIWGIGAEGQS